MVESTGDKVSSAQVDIPTVGLAVGYTNWVLAKITGYGNNESRYEYADKQFKVVSPDLWLDTVTPGSAIVSAGTTRLTLRGGGFVAGDIVVLSDGFSPLEVQPVSVSASQIVADLSLGNVVRTWNVFVRRPVAGGSPTDTEPLTVQVTSSTPTGPTITQQPTDAIVVFGQSTNFTVAATGTGTLTYQWLRNGLTVAGATTATYTTSHVSFANDGYTYQVRVTDANGTTPSRVATLNVVPPTVGCNDPMEPNDRSYEASVLPLGVTTNGLICSAADVDWFKVTMTNSGQLNLTLIFTSGQDYDLELYGPDFAWMAGSYQPAGQNEAIQRTVAAGDYFVRVYGYQAAYSPSQFYQLSANAVEVRPPGPLSGLITNAVMWSGVVKVTGDVTIVDGGSLTILPGTQVRCDRGDDRSSGNDGSRVEIILNGGTLNAGGTPEAPIRFTSRAQNTSPGDWYGIRLVQGSVRLSHFVVEFAVTGLRLEDGDTRFDSYLVEHGTIRNSSSYGLFQTGSQGTVELNDLTVNNNNGLHTAGPLLVRDSRFNRNTGSGILGDGGSLTVTNCDVSTNDSYGIQVSSKTLVVQNCTIRANLSYGLYGVYGSAEVRNSQIQRNGAIGVYLLRTSPVTFVGNTVSQNGAQGLYLQFDGGGSVSAEGITSNVIRSNDVGVAVSGNAPPVLSLSGNDIYQNISFELRNDSSMAITANDCYWDEPTTTEWTAGQVNLSRIYDLHDNPSYGQVLIQNIRGTPVLEAPRFTTQPQSVIALPGDTVTLSAAASGSAPITLQWYRNGSTVAQATNPDLILANLNASLAGNYFVVAVNAAGRATSAVAVVTLILPPNPPVIVQHPVSQTVALGGSVSFAVAATGTGPFTYQWKKNGAPIPGATAATLSFSSVLVSDVGEYTVTVTNPGGNASSQPATLTLNTSGGTAVTRQITRMGTNFFVSVTVIPPVGTPAYLVEEFIPTNFSVLNISSSGTHEPANGRIVWGAFWDGLTRTLTYTLVPPPGFTGIATLNGAALFFGAYAATGGDDQISMVPQDPVTLGLAKWFDYYVITINGTVGSSYRLESGPAANGPREPLAIFTLPRTPWSYVDWESAGQTNRFYRTVLVE